MKPNIRHITVLTFTVIAVLFLTQTASLYIPVEIITLYKRICRPAIYACLTAVFFVLTGRDERPIRKREKITLTAVINSIIFFMVMGFTALFGVSENAAASNFSVLADNIWTQGSVIFMSEILRRKIIIETSYKHRYAAMAVLTAVYTFAQLENLRNALNYDLAQNINFLFADVLPALTLNIVLSYMALESSPAALFITRSTYSLSLFILPVLPNVPKTVWGIITCISLIFTLIIYHINISGESKKNRLLSIRRAKYQKKRVLNYVIPITLTVLFIVFNLGLLPYFPIVIRSNSMSGTFDTGSIVFVEKIPAEKVFASIKAGDVIYYSDDENKMKVIHRVIEFRYNESGERVYITKGDANAETDTGFVEIYQILGISRRYIKYIGYPAVWWRNIFDDK